MKLIAAALMFVAVSAMAQDKPKEQQEPYVCYPDSVIRFAVFIIIQQQKEIELLKSKLAERQ